MELLFWIGSENSHCKQGLSNHLWKMTTQAFCSGQIPYYLPCAAISKCFTNITEKSRINRETKCPGLTGYFHILQGFKAKGSHFISDLYQYSICIKPKVYPQGKEHKKNTIVKENLLLPPRFSFNCSVTINNIKYFGMMTMVM